MWHAVNGRSEATGLTIAGMLALAVFMGCSPAAPPAAAVIPAATAAQPRPADDPQDGDDQDGDDQDGDDQDGDDQAGDDQDGDDQAGDDQAGDDQDGDDQAGDEKAGDEKAGDEKADDDQADDPAAADPADPQHPFPRRSPATEFPQDATWTNTGGAIRLRDLRGKFVLLDFWTYCCINCIHVLPELKKLEKAYPNEIVVIGVHSAKFDTERDIKNIEEAILRYEIEHPVVNDPDHRIWDEYFCRSWPSLRIIDPEGNLVAGHSGEIRFEDLDAFFKDKFAYYRDKGLLDDSPVRFELLARKTEPTALRFPGKLLADQATNRLFISDSNHNRIVVTDLDGKLLETIGRGSIGLDDGDFATATFHHPQGMALQGNTLYVADTENHALRKVDLQDRQVTTIAGRGRQAEFPWPMPEGRFVEPDRWVGQPKTTDLNSPWALWIHGQTLYIAMAGPHQIWTMPLDESEIGPYAGNSREDIVDGRLLPDRPYEQAGIGEDSFSSFAQPSGLASDGTWLFVADSEGSSIRAVPFDPNEQVKTIVGTNNLPHSRLFTFGDRDGERAEVLLQHPLGVAYHEGQIYVADTYNNKLKAVDAATGRTKTVAGDGQPGNGDEPARFDEPSGVSIAGNTLYVADTNNHLIRTVDLDSGQVKTLSIDGLRPPETDDAPKRPRFDGAAEVATEEARLAPQEGRVAVNVQLKFPAGWKVNPLAPLTYWLEVEQPEGPVHADALGRRDVEPPSNTFDVSIPVSGGGRQTVRISMNYYYCADGGEGICRVGSVVFRVPLVIAEDGEKTSVRVEHTVDVTAR